MGLYAFYFINLRCIEIMYSNISMPVSTSNVTSIWRKPQASYCLLNVLCLSNGYFIKICFLVTLNKLALLIFINRFGFKNFKFLLLQVLCGLNEDYFAHVFAVSIAEKAFLDKGSLLGRDWLIIDEVPESYRSITSTGRKSC